MSANPTYLPKLSQVGLGPIPNLAVFLLRPKQVLLLPKPNQADFLTKLNQVVFFSLNLTKLRVYNKSLLCLSLVTPTSDVVVRTIIHIAFCFSDNWPVQSPRYEDVLAETKGSPPAQAKIDSPRCKTNTTQLQLTKRQIYLDPSDHTVH